MLRIIIRINIYVKHNFLVYLLSATTCFELRSSSGHALMQVIISHVHIRIPYVYNMKTFVTYYHINYTGKINFYFTCIIDVIITNVFIL